MGVDYVVWGQRDPVAGSVVSAVYSGSSAEPLVQISHGGEVTQLASLMLSAPTTDRRLDQLESPRRGGSAEVLQGNLKRSLARNASTTREILVSLEASQQLLGLLADDPASAALLDTAVKAAEAAIKTEPTNGLAHRLLANAHFNLATAAQGRQEPEVAVAEMKEMKRSLARAYRYRNELDCQALTKEIAADYRLLIERDGPQAIQAYQELAKDPMSTPLIRRRAHWMLCGIYSGDWAVGNEIVNAAAAGARDRHPRQLGKQFGGGIAQAVARLGPRDRADRTSLPAAFTKRFGASRNRTDPDDISRALARPAQSQLRLLPRPTPNSGSPSPRVTGGTTHLPGDPSTALAPLAPKLVWGSKGRG